jgi:hypothetical protein
LATNRLKWFILPPIFVIAFTAFGIARAQITDPAPMLTIPVTGKATDGGITYTFTGNIVFPKPAPTVSIPPGPTFHGLYDAAGTYLQTPIPGTTVTAQCRNLGVTRGRVFWGWEEAVVATWSDTAVSFKLPITPLHPRGQLLVIFRADGAVTSEMVGAF